MRALPAFSLLAALALAAGSAASQPRDSFRIRDLMTASEFQKSGLGKLSETELDALDAWLVNYSVRLLAQVQASTTSSASGFANLEGAVIVAEDGTFLGKITSNSLDRLSLLNELGPHGSELRRESIFNTLGSYGSELSRLSPFNELASTPPRIFKGERFMGFLTVNRVKSPRVDPHALLGWLKAQ